MKACGCPDYRHLKKCTVEVEPRPKWVSVKWYVLDGIARVEKAFGKRFHKLKLETIQDALPQFSKQSVSCAVNFLFEEKYGFAVRSKRKSTTERAGR